MVKQAAGDTTPEALLQLLADLEDRQSVVDQLAAALGTGSGMRAEDAFWAFRKLFGALAVNRPLVLVFEDLHWAEDRLLDFVEELVERTEGVALLVVCLARPDLLEQRPAWGGGKLDAEAIQLAPLSDSSSEELIRHWEQRKRRGDKSSRVPRAIRSSPSSSWPWQRRSRTRCRTRSRSPSAVLAARIDRLSLDERSLLESASIVGLEFSLSAVAALAASDEDLAAAARRLARKDLLRPAGPDIRGRDDYRFGHILIRDVVYASVLKATRAELHEKFARWLEGDLQERASELEEIIGYHLERSYALRKELDPDDRELDKLANEAGERLAGGGRRQFDQSNVPGAIELLARARLLMADEHPQRGYALAALASAYRETARWSEARDHLDEASRVARLLGDTDLASYIRVNELQLRIETDESLSMGELVALVSRVRSSPAHAARAKSILAWAYALAGRYLLAERLIEEEVANTTYAREPRRLLPSVWLDGPRPVRDVIARCERSCSRNPRLEPLLAVTAAWPWPMRWRANSTSLGSFRRSIGES